MNLADKTVLNILATSSETLLLLISSIVMVRYFNKTDYGTFLQMMLVANTAISFTIMGLPQSIYYFFQRAINQRNFLIRNVVLSTCIGLITATIVYFLKNQFVQWLNNPLLAEYAWIAPLLIFFRTPSNFREPLLISHGSLIMNSTTTVVWNIIFFVPIIIAAFCSVSLSTLLNIMIISSATQFCLYLGVISWIFYYIHESTSKELPGDIQKKEVSFKEQIKYALPIGVSSYLGIIGRQIDQYIVSAFFTPIDFAVYSRGAMRIPFISTIPFTINNILMPKYVSAYQAGDITTLLRVFHISIEKVVKINFPVFSLLFAVAPSIVTFLYTEEYSEASSILRAYLCLLLIGIAVYGVIPRASGKPSFIMIAMSLSIMANIIFSILFVSIMGPIGAAIATVITSLIGAFYYLVQSCKILGVSFEKIFPWKYLSQVLGVSLAASIPVYFIEYLVRFEGGKTFLILLVDGLVYLYCWLFGMMRKGLIYQDDLELLTKWLRFDVKRVLQKILFLA